jgi:hypothetical protein
MNSVSEWIPGAGFLIMAIISMRKARAAALSEAADVMLGMSKTGYKSHEDYQREGEDTNAEHALNRGYYYGRASDIINSIPKDRI